MTNLGIAGAVSLNSVNQWISTINTNLNNSKRIGYKETKLSFTSGEVSSTGTTQGVGKTVNVTFPSASLEVAKTQILDYVQGNLTPTGIITDFALNGMGYFVVEDKFGTRYATRDGQFNFDTEGYLVTAEGLRVLTTGFDYFRVPASEHFSVNGEGESNSPTFGSSVIDTRFNPASGVSDISQSVYGNRKLLVIDIPTETKLMYSKYGFTKFELGRRVPIVVKNDFSEYTDGIAPYLIPDSLNGLPNTTMASFFKHDLQNGTMKMATRDVTGVTRYVQAGYGGQQYGEFNTEMDFHVRKNNGPNQIDGGFSSFGITFGKSTYDKMDNDPNTFFAGIINNQFVLKRGIVDLGSSPDVLAPPIQVDAFNALTLNPNLKLTIKLDVSDGIMRAILLQNGVARSTINVAGYSGYIGGYMSVGTARQDPNIGSGGNSRDNVIDITKINIVERNKDTKFTQNILQKNVKDDLKNGINDKYQNETVVVQQSVEESTATIADTLPMLSSAQKLFSAVSKIISVYNTMTDDVNSTLR